MILSSMVELAPTSAPSSTMEFRTSTWLVELKLTLEKIKKIKIIKLKQARCSSSFLLKPKILIFFALNLNFIKTFGFDGDKT